MNSIFPWVKIEMCIWFDILCTTYIMSRIHSTFNLGGDITCHVGHSRQSSEIAEKWSQSLKLALTNGNGCT